MKVTFTNDIGRAIVHGVTSGKTSFTLVRKGKFTVNTYGLNHCGAADGPLEIAYKLQTRCSVDSLDYRGHLFDQTNIQRWFDGQTITDMSCEEYAVYCGRELYKLIRRENGKCRVTQFSLTLSPAPFMAELTFEYSE